jgi:hypothetical protein
MKSAGPMKGDSTTEARLQRLLKRIQALAEEVRLTAERVHEETEEAHRLVAIARAELSRSRELSRAGRQELRQVHGSLEHSVETAGDSNLPDAKSQRPRE